MSEIYLREGADGAVELCVGSEVHLLRPGQLANLAVDSVRFALRSRILTPQWEAMWAKKFDYPERL